MSVRRGKPRIQDQLPKMTSLALAISSITHATYTNAETEEASLDTLDEIIVTARKRESSLQDLAASVQAFTSDDIDRLDIARFEDFAEASPSISYISAGPATQLMHIRGVSDGGIPHVFRTNVSTTTFYMDEQPVAGRGGGIPDIHLYDLERIEVLRGPESTYYGASSVSGTVRIITNAPDPEHFDYGVDTSGGFISDGDATYNIEGFVNIPVSANAAVRLVAWYDKSDGFIDNLPSERTYTNGVTVSNAAWAGSNYNEEETVGARASLFVKLNDDWEVTASAMSQALDTVGAWDHDPDRVGDLQVERFGPEFTNADTSTMSLVFKGSTDIGDLVYAASYYDLEDLARNDYSDYVEYASFGAWIQQHACEDFYWYGFTGCNDPSIFFDSETNVSKTSHELRLTSNGESPLNWIVGAYQETNEYQGFLFWEMPGINFDAGPAAYYTTGAGITPLPNEWWSCPGWDNEDSEFSIFGEVSYAFTVRTQCSAC
ncbi:MAG: TonB-dependent receptor plug domain-containing protein [Pseudomonadota bacterium]